MAAFCLCCPLSVLPLSALCSLLSTLYSLLSALSLRYRESPGKGCLGALPSTLSLSLSLSLCLSLSLSISLSPSLWQCCFRNQVPLSLSPSLSVSLSLSLSLPNPRPAAPTSQADPLRMTRGPANPPPTPSHNTPRTTEITEKRGSYRTQKIIPQKKFYVVAPGALAGFSCRAPENNSKIIFPACNHFDSEDITLINSKE